VDKLGERALIFSSRANTAKTA